MTDMPKCDCPNCSYGLPHDAAAAAGRAFARRMADYAARTTRDRDEIEALAFEQQLDEDNG